MSAHNPILTVIICILGLGTAVECTAQAYHPPTGQIYHIRDSMELRFSAMRDSMPDSLFYHEGGEYAEFQKWFRHWELRAPHGSMDAYDRVFQGYVGRQAHANSGFRSDDDPWIEIGPKRIANNMFGIGPIRHIAISKDNSEHMLCTSNSGGLFHTADANASCTWHNAGTDMGLPHSGCNWADFYPGSTDKWYTSSSYGRGVAYVGGLYRTNNNGTDWESIADHTDLEGPNT